MKKMFLLFGISSLFVWSTAAYATFSSGSTGALGNYTATVSKVIQLPPDGILNYQSVHIYPNATITFQKNAANTPVYMLATGDVLIEGTINANGAGGSPSDVGRGGPGGFDGGYGGPATFPGGKGLGPGGGSGGTSSQGAGGGFGIAGGNTGVSGGGVYGNATLLPIIGGSGGGGAYAGLGNTGGAGGGGGGAIVIASSTSITITGTITANGGSGGGGTGNSGGGGGSGGGIKLIANTISGTGSIMARGAAGGPYAGSGGAGRIRLEASINYRTAGTDPPYSYGLPGSIFPASPPSLTITSVGGTTAPSSPTGNYNQPDIILPSNSNPVTVNVSATNIPPGTTATVWVIPQYGAAIPPSGVNTILSGTQQSSTASASVTLSTIYSNVITAQSTFTITGMYYNGDEIVKARVAATLGGKSKTVYITKSGKEIKGELIAGLAQ